jgi:hypothetical protein
MLDQNDKDFLVDAIKKAVKEELTVEITWEQHRDEKTGNKLAVPKIKNEKVFLPSFFVQQLYFQEGAFRGIQEDLNKSVSKISITKEGIQALANILIQMEDGITQFVRLGEEIKNRIEHSEVKKIACDN